jgi:hypothetical protein
MAILITAMATGRTVITAMAIGHTVITAMAIGPTVMGMAGATSQEKPIHYLAPSHYAELFRSTAESKPRSGFSDFHDYSHNPSEFAGLFVSCLPSPPTKLIQRNGGIPIVPSPQWKLDEPWRVR